MILYNMITYDYAINKNIRKKRLFYTYIDIISHVEILKFKTQVDL